MQDSRGHSISFRFMNYISGNHMRTILTLLFLVLNIKNGYCQSKNSIQVLTLDQAIEKVAKYDKLHFVRVKYDSNLNPYAEVIFLNENKKQITTMQVLYIYFANGFRYIEDETIKCHLNSNVSSKFKLRFHRSAKKSSFKLEKVEISVVRYADGTIDDMPQELKLRI